MHSHIAILEVACELTGLVLTVQLDTDISRSRTSCARRVDANLVKKNTLYVLLNEGHGRLILSSTIFLIT